MDEILKLDNISQYNSMRGVETFHPLVSVVGMSKASPTQSSRIRFGFYCVFLKEIKCGNLKYGCNYYDYQGGTLVFVAPGQILGVNSKEQVQPKGWALLFHPDLIRGTSLGHNIKDYTFFSYEVNEALHLSEKEKQIVIGRRLRAKLCSVVPVLCHFTRYARELGRKFQYFLMFCTSLGSFGIKKKWRKTVGEAKNFAGITGRANLFFKWLCLIRNNRFNLFICFVK